MIEMVSYKQVSKTISWFKNHYLKINKPPAAFMEASNEKKTLPMGESLRCAGGDLSIKKMCINMGH